ncbi:MAG: Glycerate kinase [Acidobacteria bacterium]|nr:Glycerate kinase [Acidobacteriota bacterium]
MVRPEEGELSLLPRFRRDLPPLFGAALAAVDPPRLLGAAISNLSALDDRRAVRLLAVGKAAPWLADACAALLPGRVREGLVVGTHCPIQLPAGLEWREASHPVPDQRSVDAARAALGLVRALRPDEELIVLISGGASALLALPRPGITLEDKRETTRRLLGAGADITALNTVRKHLSLVKGGQLGVAAGRGVALAVSDVVGDDLGVIASGPTVPDPTTFADALSVLGRHGGARAYPARVVALLERGAAGEAEETPKPGERGLQGVRTRVIGSGREAAAAVAREAAARGYRVAMLDRPLVGEARDAGASLVAEGRRLAAQGPLPACVVAHGETTVHVTGDGRGGRNQELALAAAIALDASGVGGAVLSGGTDGVDGPTDAAGAVADSATIPRARAEGLDPLDFLRRNDAYTFFSRLGDLLMTGPTHTNVGDVQILLIG